MLILNEIDQPNALFVLSQIQSTFLQSLHLFTQPLEHFSEA